MKPYRWKLQWGMFPTEACIWPRGPQLVNRLWNLRRWSLARGRTSLGVLWGCLALSYFLFPLCFLFMSKDWFSWFPVPALLPCLPLPRYYGSSLPMEPTSKYTLASLSCFWSWYFMTSGERKQTEAVVDGHVCSFIFSRGRLHIYPHMYINPWTRPNFNCLAFENNLWILCFSVLNPSLTRQLDSCQLPSSFLTSRWSNRHTAWSYDHSSEATWLCLLSLIAILIGLKSVWFPLFLTRLVLVLARILAISLQSPGGALLDPSSPLPGLHALCSQLWTTVSCISLGMLGWGDNSP